jgi:hypothetical protein
MVKTLQINMQILLSYVSSVFAQVKNILQIQRLNIVFIIYCTCMMTYFIGPFLRLNIYVLHFFRMVDFMTNCTCVYSTLYQN